jgi:four helix bundle protein
MPTTPNEPTMVVQKAYDWTLWIIPKVERFPKSQRYSIGEHLVRASIDLLLYLVDATYQSRNSGSLHSAVREVNRIRYLVRLAKDLRLITIDSHEFAAKAIDDIGRMAGGWRRSVRAAVSPEAPL